MLKPVNLENGSILKVLESANAAALYTVLDRNRDHLRPWMPWIDTTLTVTDSEKFIETTIKQNNENKGFHAGIWVAGELAGVIGYHPIDRVNSKVALGYWLSADKQGRGLITSACRFFLDHAFERLRLNKVEIHSATTNLKSRAVPERLGFIEEAIVRHAAKIGNTFHDHVIYGMLAPEWLNSR